jgi:branched-chain amino acid transport system permease protein
MSVGIFATLFVAGISTGMAYVLIACGFTLIYSIMNILNFAHGEFYMLGAFAAFYLVTFVGTNYLLTIVIAMLLLGLLGALVEWLFFRPLRGEHDPNVIIAISLMIIMSSAAFLIFGGEFRGVSTVFPGVLRVFTINISLERLIIIIIAMALMVALFFFLQRTKIGKALRAASQNPTAASLQGINVDRMSSLGFGLSCALAGAAGVLMVPLFYVNPFIGGHWVFKALLVVVIGGLGSISGAVLGGLILGLLESFTSAILGGMSEAIGFAAVIVILLLRPQGLLGRR